MSTQKSPAKQQQVYQSIQQPYDVTQRNLISRNMSKHYNTCVDDINRTDHNSQKAYTQFFVQNKNITGIQNNRINSANSRSSSVRKNSIRTNTPQKNSEQKVTILKSNTSSINRNGNYQQSYSTLNQQQSTIVSSFLQYSGINNQSQQFMQTTPQISQILSGSQLSQSQSSQSQTSRTSQYKSSQPSDGLKKQKSNFMQALKHDNQNNYRNLILKQNCNQMEQEENSQNLSPPLLNKEFVLHLEIEDQKQKIAQISSSSSLKEKESILLQNNQAQRNCLRQASNNKTNGQIDQKLQSVLQFSNQEQHKYHFYKPAPIQKYPKNSYLPPENKGDQQVSIQEESMTMVSLQLSSMMESSKMREKSHSSNFINTKRSRLTKRLLDLQEPRNIQEEEDEEEETLSYFQTRNSENDLDSPQNQKNGYENNKNNQDAQSQQKWQYNINKISPQEMNLDLDIDYQYQQSTEEFSPHQKPPSMTARNKQQMMHDWNNSKSPQDRKNFETSETLQSFCNSKQFILNKSISEKNKILTDCSCDNIEMLIIIFSNVYIIIQPDSIMTQLSNLSQYNQLNR